MFMITGGGSTFQPAKQPKRVHFPSSVDVQQAESANRQKQKEIVDFLVNAKLIMTRTEASLKIVDQAIQKVKDFFLEGSEDYNKWMAKCLVQKCILLPLEQGEPFLKKANELDSTNRKFSYCK